MSKETNSDAQRAREYAFGAFVFDALRRELRRNGDRIELNPQPARLLEALLARAPEIVSRETLQRELWGGKATVEFEQGLNTCIGQLRTALGESARAPVYIKTEPKHGYRFLAPVRIKNGERLRARFGLVSVALVGLGAVFLLAMLLLRSPASPGTLKAADSAIHEIILQGRALRKFGDVDVMAESLAQFEKALSRAPEEPAAMEGVALNLAVLAGSNGLPVAETYARANTLAANALTLNRDAVDALLARGFIALYDQWDIDAARRDFERARSLAPDYPLAHAWLAAVYAASGNSKKAVASSNKAAELDPVSWYVQADRCWFLLYDGAHERAFEACAGAVEMQADLVWSRFGLMEAYRAVGDHQAAAEELALIAAYVGLEGDRFSGSAEARYEDMSCALGEQLAVREGGAANYLIAALYAQCGDFARASPWLQKATVGGESFVLFYDLDPRFADYRISDAARASPVIIKKRH